MREAGDSPEGRGAWPLAIVAGSVVNLLLFGALAGVGDGDHPLPVPRAITLSLDFSEKAIPAAKPTPKPSVATPRPRKREKKRHRRSPPQSDQVVSRPIEEATEAEEEQRKPSPPSPPLAGTPKQQPLPDPVPVYQLTGLPRFIHQERPNYPPRLRRQGKEATVKLEIYIDADGRVREIRVLKSAGEDFDRAAIAAIRASTFAPGNVDGKPVPVLMRLPIRFRLR